MIPALRQRFQTHLFFLCTFLFSLICPSLLSENRSSSNAHGGGGNNENHSFSAPFSYAAGIPWPERFRESCAYADGFNWKERAWNAFCDNTEITNHFVNPIRGITNEILENISTRCQRQMSRQNVPGVLACGARMLTNWYLNHVYIRGIDRQMPDLRGLAKSYRDLAMVMNLPGVEVNLFGLPDIEVNRVTYAVNGNTFSYILSVGESRAPEIRFYPFTGATIAYHRKHGNQLPSSNVPASQDGYTFTSFFTSRQRAAHASPPIPRLTTQPHTRESKSRN